LHTFADRDKARKASQKNFLLVIVSRDGGHEQLISNGERFKFAFADRDKKQTIIDFRGT
jgi:hypothetical protein